MSDFRGNDRAVVASALARARAEGRLTDAEYEERLNSVNAAETYAALVALTGDLPADGHAPPTARAAPRRLRPTTPHPSHQPKPVNHQRLVAGVVVAAACLAAYALLLLAT
ncbi:DUF1707 SHOCT-like domain-containing protein [Saccharothrix obliqua]|uniref:DUF1707 SHOCT-like domain-containing protein n=1 Tax=Saccharothrix obliqua TaxID=2861747 RepID=UPI001C5EF753|nr:DUF1707 domain-containing protein [Saccharothrix obliqua]MBW4715983.1 DUF1707 domain-containing protein [Saccharothrix obliqua]